MADRTLVVRLVGDERDLLRSFARSKREAQGFQAQLVSSSRAAQRADRFGLFGGGSARGVAAGAAGGALALGLDNFTRKLTESVTLASDLNEQVSKSRQLFGSSSGEIEQWSRSTARSLGIARTEALAATGTLGNLFATVDLDRQRAAGLSRQLVVLAADLASFNNANPTDVLDAIRSGLIGEAEPLRRYGVLLSEARVQQEALAQSGKTSVKQLTDQEKLLARVAIILRDTEAAQGDAARTAESFANQQRILSAQLRDLQTNLGTLVLPAFTDLITLLNEGTTAAMRLGDALDRIGDVDIPGAGSDVGDFVKGALEKTIQGLPNVGPLAKALQELRQLNEQQPVRGTVASPVPGGFPFLRSALDPKAVESSFPKVPKIDVGPEMGPLITRLSNRLKEELLDARLATPDALKDDLDVLERQRAFLQRAIQDPRLTRAQRIDLKAVLDGVLGDIAQLQESVAESIDKQLGVPVAQSLALVNAKIAGDASGELAALRAQQAELERLSRTVKGEELLQVREQLLSVVDAIRSAEEQIADDAARRAQEAKDAVRRAAEAATSRRNARQFEALGLLDTGEERAPGVPVLRRQLARIREQVGGTDLDTAAVRKQLAGISDVLLGEFGTVGRKVRLTIQDIFAGLEAQLDQTSRRILTKTRSLNTTRELQGLNLSRDDERTLIARLSRFNTAGVALAGQAAAGAFGMPVGADGRPIVVKVELDGQLVGRAVTKQQQRTASRNPVQTRGRNF